MGAFYQTPQLTIISNKHTKAKNTMQKTNRQTKRSIDNHGAEDVSIHQFMKLVMKEFAVIQREISEIKKDIGKTRKEDPLIDTDYIMKDLSAGRTKFNRDILPHLTFLFKPAGMRVYRCRLSDYERWKEKQYKELSFDRNIKN
jgi:hypothetical protein